MEKLLSLGQQVNNKLMLYAHGTKLYVALNNGKDALEFTGKVSQPLDENTEINKITQDIQTVIQIIEILKINKRIFM